MKYEYTCSRCGVTVVDATQRLRRRAFHEWKFEGDTSGYRNHRRLVRLRSKYKKQYETAIYNRVGLLGRLLGVKPKKYCDVFTIDAFLELFYPIEYWAVGNYFFTSVPDRNSGRYYGPYELFCEMCVAELGDTLFNGSTDGISET